MTKLVLSPTSAVQHWEIYKIYIYTPRYVPPTPSRSSWLHPFTSSDKTRMYQLWNEAWAIKRQPTPWQPPFRCRWAAILLPCSAAILLPLSGVYDRIWSDSWHVKWPPDSSLITSRQLSNICKLHSKTFAQHLPANIEDFGSYKQYR